MSSDKISSKTKTGITIPRYELRKVLKFYINKCIIKMKSNDKLVEIDISHKSLIDSKLLRIRFDKIDWFTRVYHGTRYLILFVSEKYNSIYDGIIYLLGVQSGITYIISHNYATIKVDLYNSLSLEKIMTLRNVIILVTSVWKKFKNNYCYIFRKKVLTNYLKNRLLY